MELDEIGKLLGMGATTFLASFALLIKQVRARDEKEDDIRKLLSSTKEDHQRQLDDLKEQLKDQVDEMKSSVKSSLDEMKEAVKSLEERARRFVDTDDFSQYTQHTTANLTRLAEKIGRATGALEAWHQRDNIRPR